MSIGYLDRARKHDDLTQIRMRVALESFYSEQNAASLSENAAQGKSKSAKQIHWKDVAHKC